MLDISSVSALVAAVSVIVGVIYYTLQIRHQTKLRQMGLLMNLYMTWGSEDMKKATGRFLAIGVKNYSDFVEKHGPVVSVEPERSQIWNDIDRIGWFFNGIGFLVY